MRQKLHTEMKQKVDDEDERIAKTVAERERKRLVCFETPLYSLYMFLRLFMFLFFKESYKEKYLKGSMISKIKTSHYPKNSLKTIFDFFGSLSEVYQNVYCRGNL